MVDVDVMDGLSRALLSVASEPLRTDALYKVLGEFCHAVRNRLSCLKISMHIARLDAPEADRASWEELERMYGAIERFMEQLHTICRPVNLDPVPIELGLVMEDRRVAWTYWLARRRIHLSWNPPPKEPTGLLDPIKLADALNAFICWRAETIEPDSEVHLTWEPEDEDQQHCLTWIETTPEPVRDTRRSGSGPAALALAMLARVISAHQGTIEVDAAAGLRVRLRWPVHAGQGMEKAIA